MKSSKMLSVSSLSSNDENEDEDDKSISLSQFDIPSSYDVNLQTDLPDQRGQKGFNDDEYKQRCCFHEVYCFATGCMESMMLEYAVMKATSCLLEHYYDPSVVAKCVKIELYKKGYQGLIHSVDVHYRYEGVYVNKKSIIVLCLIPPGAIHRKTIMYVTSESSLEKLINFKNMIRSFVFTNALSEDNYDIYLLNASRGSNASPTVHELDGAYSKITSYTQLFRVNVGNCDVCNNNVPKIPAIAKSTGQPCKKCVVSIPLHGTQCHLHRNNGN